MIRPANNTMPVDPETLRNVMRRWAAGVTIVSSAGDGLQHGMTVTSFTSISLDPPLVLVSLEKSTRTHSLVMRAGFFAVSLLRRGQEHISNRFGGWETEYTNRFEGLATRTESTGAPILSDCMAYLDCNVVAAHDAGNHTLFIGEVLRAENLDRGEPLIYFNRKYRCLSDPV